MEPIICCSLGTLCHGSQILKNNQLKKCSYPFDWIFSNCDNIIHCIEDDFKIFLDKSYYVTISDKQCGHSYYNKHMWWHHNPLVNEDDYNYYGRCVNRFKELLQSHQRKLFIMIFVNMVQMEESIKENILNFNEKFSKYTQNYKLLVVFHIAPKEDTPTPTPHHTLTSHDNTIDFLELHTLSLSNGVNFINDEDNNYLNLVIKKSVGE